MDPATRQILDAILAEGFAVIDAKLRALDPEAPGAAAWVDAGTASLSSGTEYRLRHPEKLLAANAGAEALAWTYVLATAAEQRRWRFFEEDAKRRAGQPHDARVIGEYYADFAGGPAFDGLRDGLAKQLESRFPGRHFVPARTVVTRGFHFALVYFDLDTLMAALQLRLTRPS